MRNSRLIAKIEEILDGQIMPTALIHDCLQDATAEIKNGRKKPWKHTPTKRKVTNILTSHPQFKRVNDKYPALWTYNSQEE